MSNSGGGKILGKRKILGWRNVLAEQNDRKTAKNLPEEEEGDIPLSEVAAMSGLTRQGLIDRINRGTIIATRVRRTGRFRGQIYMWVITRAEFERLKSEGKLRNLRNIGDK